MGILITLVVWLIILAILFAIVRAVLPLLGIPIANNIVYLVFLLIVLLVFLNVVGFLGEPFTFGSLGRGHC